MKKEIFLKAIACSAFLITSLFADQNDEERVVIADNDKTFREEVAEIQQKNEEIQFIEEHQVTVTNPEEKVETIVSGGYNENYYEGCYHFVATIGANGFNIDLLDGSTWDVHPRDRYIVSNTSNPWKDGDSILIGTSSHVFNNSSEKGSYRFEAYNRRTFSRVKIEPTGGPFASKCRAISDFGFNRVSLNDGSSWEISTFDAGMTRKWKVTHSIILGINNTWDSSWNPYILYNVDTNQYVRVRKIYY